MCALAADSRRDEDIRAGRPRNLGVHAELVAVRAHVGRFSHEHGEFKDCSIQGIIRITSPLVMVKFCKLDFLEKQDPAPSK